MNVSLQYIVYGVCIQTILRENGVGSCSNNGTHTKKSKIWRDQDVRGFETWVVRYQNYTAVKLGGDSFFVFLNFFIAKKVVKMVWRRRIILGNQNARNIHIYN